MRSHPRAVNCRAGGMSEDTELEPLTLPESSVPDSDIPVCAVPGSANATQSTQDECTSRTRPPLAPLTIPKNSFVSVSAVLSRTGEIRYLPEFSSDQDSELRSRRMLPRRSSDVALTNEALVFDGRRALSQHSTPILGPIDGESPMRKHQTHTGSALEAISALLLQRNGAGRLDELSLRKTKGSSSMPSLSLPLWIHTLEARRLIFFVIDAVRQMLPSAPAAVPSTEAIGRRQRTGLAWGEIEDLEIPPTPVAMPGAFAHDDSDSLLLPPPLLDEGSDPHSFEGILGVRLMRERLQRQQLIDKLNERNRPIHRAGPLTAISNFVKAAKASEARNKPVLRRRRSTGLSSDMFGMRYFRGHRPGTAKPVRLGSSLPNSPAFPSVPELENHALDAGELHQATTDAAAIGKDTAGPDTDSMAELSLSPAPLDAAPHDVPRTEDTSHPLSTPNTTPPEKNAMARLTPLAMLNGYRPESTPNSLPEPQNQPVGAKPEDVTTLGTAWVGLSFLFVAVVAIPDFAVFIMAYVIDFAVEMYQFVASTLWFVRWIWMNMTGRTVLGRCAIDAYLLVQGEWAFVAKEDHEGRLERRKPLGFRRRGLTTFQVIRSILELMCLQEVTRKRYERESGGLELLEGWRDTTNDIDDNDDETDIFITNHTNDIVELSRAGKDDNTRSHGMWSDDCAAFVRNIKWASRLAVSAYGLQVLIVDLPPVFTPSGRKFPQQTFAHLSRLDANDVLHAEIQTMDDDEVYSPTFYIVRDMVRQVVCVAVRGTQSFADVIVDLDMLAEDVTDSLPEWRGVPRKNPHGELVYHAGIWRAAKALVDPESKLSKKLKEALEEHPGFGLVFVGHSLGGAIASAAAILLSEYHLHEEGEEDPRRGVWRTNGSSGLPTGRRIRAITFANPSIVSEPLAKRTAYGIVPLISTIIFRHDILPRFGHGQVRELRRLLGALTRVRGRRAMASTTVSKDPSHMEEKEDAVVHILSRYWDWRSIYNTENPDAVMRDKQRRIENQFWHLRSEVEEDLFAHAKWRFDNAEELKGDKKLPVVDGAPLHKRTTRRQRLDAATLSGEAAQGGPLIPPVEVYWINNGELYRVRSPLAFFSVPDFQPSMFADHFPGAYEEAILGLGTTN